VLAFNSSVASGDAPVKSGKTPRKPTVQLLGLVAKSPAQGRLRGANERFALGLLVDWTLVSIKRRNEIGADGRPLTFLRLIAVRTNGSACFIYSSSPCRG
jgi:hypothetical protein